MAYLISGGGAEKCKEIEVRQLLKLWRDSLGGCECLLRRCFADNGG